MSGASDFTNHDWEGDTRWHEYKKTLEFSSSDENEVLKKMKVRYWRKYVDPSFDPNAKPSSSSSSNAQQGSSNGSDSNSQSNNSSSSSSRPNPSSRSVPPAPHSVGQQVWLLGQFSILLCSLLYLIPFVFDPRTSYTFYSCAFYSGMLVHLLGLFRAVGLPRMNREWWIRLGSQDGVHYVMVYFLLANSYPITVALAPLCIYSFFHVCSFLHANSSVVLTPPMLSKYRTSVEPQLRNALTYETKALLFASNAEILTILPLLVSLFIGQGSLLVLIGYYFFLNFKYITSPSTRNVMDSIGYRLDGVFHSPRCPAVVRQIYTVIRHFLRQRMQQQPPP
eukprot:TRINITY_DN8671_c0_g1_i1.p1 TRINITY_DN8671_c0_g1~~TRINITY_DN8671_c0_g1_i1.p1  ORF type:complete len:378 (-),score=36.28 TRINITY_DN8671_c0_g1_i1:164-1171(-)